LRDGISFDFPQNTSLPAGGFLLLVSFDPVASPAKLMTFRSTYFVPTNVSVLGPYTGKLSDSGEVLEFLEPDQPQGPLAANPGFAPYMQTERIKYSIAAPWPVTAVGTGRSLQRRVALDYGNEPLNWSSSAPTAGRANVLDSDGDGMPDGWEDEHDLNPDSPLDAADDPDLDGAGNLREFQAGTNPGDDESVFEFTSVVREGNAVRFRFHAVQGRSYSLQARDSFSHGPWQIITNLPAAGVTGEREILVPGLTNAGQLFQLSTPVTP